MRGLSLLWMSTVALLLLHLQTARAASILDLLWDWGEDAAPGLEQRDTQTAGGGGGGSRTCSCDGPACNCCVDFNLTFVDLGGPGCVKMTYISPEEGIAVNVSYGESLLHSENVKGANPEPTCIDMLSELAQVCAHFVDLAPTRDGLRWCLQIEPVLLGEVQAEYHVGCFRMAPGGMHLDPTYNYTKPAAPPASNSSTAAPTEEEGEEDEEEESPAGQINEEALLAAVSETAEQGIAFFSNLLGLTLGAAAANGTAAEPASSTQPPPHAGRAAAKAHSAHSALNDLK